MYILWHISLFYSHSHTIPRTAGKKIQPAEPAQYESLVPPKPNLRTYGMAWYGMALLNFEYQTLRPVKIYNFSLFMSKGPTLVLKLNEKCNQLQYRFQLTILIHSKYIHKRHFKKDHIPTTWHCACCPSQGQREEEEGLTRWPAGRPRGMVWWGITTR